LRRFVNVGCEGNEEMTEEEMKAALAEKEQELANLKGSNERLIGENSKYKSRAQEVETKLTEAQKLKLEDEGKLQERLDLEKKERQTIESKFNEQKNVVLTEKLKAGLAIACPDAHPKSIDLMLNVKEHRDLLKIDEDNLTVAGVNDFVGKLRETHNFFFTSEKLPETETRTPSGDTLDKPLSEAEQYSKELKNAKTQTELDAVRKKFGRL